MTFDTQTILTPSLQVLGYEIQRLVQEGYEIDPNQPPSVDAVCYECGMRKAVGDDTRVGLGGMFGMGLDGFSGADELAPVVKKAGRPRKNPEA